MTSRTTSVTWPRSSDADERLSGLSLLPAPPAAGAFDGRLQPCEAFALVHPRGRRQAASPSRRRFAYQGRSGGAYAFPRRTFAILEAASQPCRARAAPAAYVRRRDLTRRYPALASGGSAVPSRSSPARGGGPPPQAVVEGCNPLGRALHQRGRPSVTPCRRATSPCRGGSERTLSSPDRGGGPLAQRGVVGTRVLTRACRQGLEMPRLPSTTLRAVPLPVPGRDSRSPILRRSVTNLLLHSPL
ncbi:hypothetical protein HNO88_002376 [Novosphingobium chloroacetimidivorans]|uniref:Uncharacterized protein n=1 Tax=Novosphingobium chloroacetimidivorans TaxID=1428314 RepID=A0A7W7KAL5_9SPHN|nr:hypothetical protein [Novosphingobium chloroacetimidivorans]